MVLLGLLMTHVLSTGPVHTADLGVDRWFAAHRTGLRNDVSYVGTTLAQTTTAISVAAVVVLLLRWRLGRWYESLVMITVMAGELLIFLCVTLVVHRPRPPVARLDVAPETSSFPSGHTAAAVALYGCIAILVLWIYGRRPATRAVVAALCCVPVIVGLSRLYRGMRYPSDVLAGALTGGLWLLVVITTLLPQWGQRQRAARQRGQRGQHGQHGIGHLVGGARRR
ncbi:MAG: phosphatase PAP2 family protein [Streptosporangiaceae bacterium]|jgi:undecaprenyl-diphosphatase|nr:phosphoesterase PA-phosphatase [Actinomycetota bacterium]